MNVVKHYTTPLGEMTLYDNGFQKEIWEAKELTNLAQVKAHMKTTNQQLQGMEQVFLLIDASATQKLSKDVRDFFPTMKLIFYLLRLRYYSTLFLRRCWEVLC